MRQIDVYKKMTGEERLLQGIRLSSLIRNIAFSSIKNDFPKISQRSLIKKYLARLTAAQYGRVRNSAKAGATT